MQPLNKPHNGRTTPNTHTTYLNKTNTLPKKPQPDQISNHSSKSTNSNSQTETENRPVNNNNETSQVDGYEDKVQGELLEIINDFKNNVFTLSEVEQLVDNWRKRNDVQKSFKEKEDQLNSMRREYERIQQQMKDDMKRPTPFDRIRKLFIKSPRPKQNTITNITRDVKFESTYLGGEDKTNIATGVQNTLRPISSLSLQSTASTAISWMFLRDGYLFYFLYNFRFIFIRENEHFEWM